MSQVEKNKDSIAAPAATLPDDETVAEKTYHSRYPGSNFIDKVGQIHEFRGNGDLVTTSRNLQKELDLISDKPGSPVYTKDKPFITPADEAPAEEIKSRAAEITKQLKEAQAKTTQG